MAGEEGVLVASRQGVGESPVEELATPGSLHLVEDSPLVEGETETENGSGHAGQEEHEEGKNQGLAGLGSAPYHPEPPAPRRATTK
jgi:hypothetical protein